MLYLIEYLNYKYKLMKNSSDIPETNKAEKKSSKPLIIIILILSIIFIATLGILVFFLINNSNEDDLEDTLADDVEDTKVEDTDIDDKSDDNYNREFVAEDVWANVPTIKVDDNDFPHIAFYNREFGDLMYATKASGEWEYETVDNEGDVGTETGIDIDSKGNVHIAYKDTTNGNTKYAVKSNDEWEVSILDEVPDTHHTVYVDLEIDSNDRPHVVYHTELNEGEDEDNNDMSIVKYAVLEGDTWAIEEIAPIGQFTQIDLDSNDVPHILYVIEPEEQTIHAYKEGTEWIYEEIDPEAGNRRDVEIQLDTDDNIHIIYHDTDGGLVKYYFCDKEGNSTIETVDSGFSTEGLGYKGIKLDVEPDGTPHIVYFNGTRGGFTHAVKFSDEWQYEILDECGYPSIAVDSGGKAHIAHTYPLDGPREMAPEVVEREENDLEQVVYQLID